MHFITWAILKRAPIYNIYIFKLIDQLLNNKAPCQKNIIKLSLVNNLAAGTNIISPPIYEFK
jgi:hypothetical protein